MIRFRAFLNVDSPFIVSLWNHQPPRRGLAQPLTLELFEQCVLAKPFFDRQGFLIAEQDDRPIGFAHASFGPNVAGTDIDTACGVVNLVLLEDVPQCASIARDLLDRAEAYLIQRGARTLVAGCAQPTDGFYLGLYGRGESPGISEADADSLDLFRGAGYVEVESHQILQRSLAGFRPLVDRWQLLARRQYRVEPDAGPVFASWWEAWALSPFDCARYALLSNQSGDLCGSVVTWGWEQPLDVQGARTVGLHGLHIHEDLRRHGLGVFLVGEMLRTAQGRGVDLAVVQIADPNLAALALFRKLGFQPIDRGLVLKKTPPTG